MPLSKLSFGQPIVLNRNYLRSITGILKCVQCVIGFISFITIWLSCRSNYDPYLGVYSGFVGGDIETFAILVYFNFFFYSTFTITTYYFSIAASTIVPKTVFEFVYNVLAFFILFLISLILFIIIVARNQSSDGFPNEPGFGGKVTASIFGFLNSIAYFADTYFSYQSYIHS